jgi:hypothetical protein
MFGKIFKSFLYRPFSKRVVRDHLIEQRVKRMTYKPDPQENTSEHDDISDFEEYRANVLHQSNLVNKKYDKKINKSEKDLKDYDFHNMNRDYLRTVEDYLKNDDILLDPLDEQRKEKTKKILRSIKTNSTFDYIREKNQDKVTEEYNNYTKFDRNFTFYTENLKNQMLDKGNTNMTAKINDYVSRLGVAGEISNNQRTNVKILEMTNKKIDASSIESMLKSDQELHKTIKNHESPTITTKKHHFGRMSPHAREEIYSLYKNGWSIKDISLKYGILPLRAAAIIWCRCYFHDSIAPHFGRTFWRLGLEREIMYASEYPFVDYGLDLDVMAYFEKGMEYVKFGDSTIDINPPQEVIDKVKNAVDKLPKRRAYTIHRGTIGTGFKKYDIKDIVIRRGNGKLDVSEMFKRICYRGDITPYNFPKKVQERLHLGPRIASLGYRVGPRSNRPIRFYNKKYHSQ